MTDDERSMVIHRLTVLEKNFKSLSKDVHDCVITLTAIKTRLDFKKTWYTPVVTGVVAGVVLLLVDRL